MECAHRQLRAWLTDALCSNDTDSFTAIDQMPPAKVPSVAGCANAILGLAGHRRAHLDPMDGVLLNQLNHLFGDHLSRFNDDFATGWRLQIFRGRTAQNPAGKRHHDFSTLDQCFQLDAIRGSTIKFCHNQILTDINQSPCQVAGIGCLQRGVGKSFSGTMG